MEVLHVLPSGHHLDELPRRMTNHTGVTHRVSKINPLPGILSESDRPREIPRVKLIGDSLPIPLRPSSLPSFSSFLDR